MKHFSALNHSMSFPSFTYFVLYFNLRLRENIVYAVNLLSKSKVEFKSLQDPLSNTRHWKWNLWDWLPSMMRCFSDILSITIGFFPKSKKMTLDFPHEVIFLRKLKWRRDTNFTVHSTVQDIVKSLTWSTASQADIYRETVVTIVVVLWFSIFPVL